MFSRLNWSPQEQQLISYLRETQKIKSWVYISKEVNKLTQVYERTPKQCRDRYVNFCRLQGKGQAQGEKSNIDLKMFVLLFIKYGSQWAKIAEHFPKHSENSIKNKMFSLLRKLSTRVNRLYRKTAKRSLTASSLKENLQALRSELWSAQTDQQIKNIFFIFKKFLSTLQIVNSHQYILDETLRQFRVIVIEHKLSMGQLISHQNRQLLTKNSEAREQELSEVDLVIRDMFELNQEQINFITPLISLQFSRRTDLKQRRTMQNQQGTENPKQKIQFDIFHLPLPKEMFQWLEDDWFKKEADCFKPSTLEDFEEELKIIQGFPEENLNNTRLQK